MTTTQIVIMSIGIFFTGFALGGLVMFRLLQWVFSDLPMPEVNEEDLV